jgi:hypothetical protein
VQPFLVVTLLAVALTVGGRADAGSVSTMAECRAACGDAISTLCGGIVKHHKFMMCQQRLLKQCKRFGVGQMCPPPAPPAPTTTTTTPPAPPTTTTTVVTPPPPTTTTAPVIINPLAASYAGVWTYFATLLSDTCATPDFLASSDTLALTTFSDGSAVGTVPDIPEQFTGGLQPDGSMLVSAGGLVNAYGCVVTYGLGLEPPVPAYASSTTGGIVILVDCPGAPECSVTYSAVWYR